VGAGRWAIGADGETGTAPEIPENHFLPVGQTRVRGLVRGASAAAGGACTVHVGRARSCGCGSRSGWTTTCRPTGAANCAPLCSARGSSDWKRGSLATTVGRSCGKGAGRKGLVADLVNYDLDADADVVRPARASASASACRRAGSRRPSRRSRPDEGATASVEVKGGWATVTVPKLWHLCQCEVDQDGRVCRARACTAPKNTDQGAPVSAQKHVGTAARYKPAPTTSRFGPR